MSVSYAGKTPSRLWYARQYAKAFATTPFKKETRPAVKTAGKNGAISLAFPVVTLKVLLPVLGLPGLLLPFLPPLAAVGGVVGCVIFGRKALRNIHDLKKSHTVSDYIRLQESKWLESRVNPGIISRAVSAVRSGLGKPAKMLHLGRHKTTTSELRNIQPVNDNKKPKASPSFQNAAAPPERSGAAPVSESRRAAADAREARRKAPRGVRF